MSVSPIWQPQETFVGFEDLPCHLKGVAELPGNGVGQEGEGTAEPAAMVKICIRKTSKCLYPQALFATLREKMFAFDYLRFNYFSAISQAVCHLGSSQAIWSRYNTVQCGTLQS